MENLQSLDSSIFQRNRTLPSAPLDAESKVSISRSDLDALGLGSHDHFICGRPFDSSTKRHKSRQLFPGRKPRALTEMPTSRHINLLLVDSDEAIAICLSPNAHDGSGLLLSEAKRRSVAMSCSAGNQLDWQISHIHQSAARRDSSIVSCPSLPCLSILSLSSSSSPFSIALSTPSSDTCASPSSF